MAGKKAIGERCAEIRSRHGWSQQQLADYMTAAGVPTKRTAIAHAEGGNGYPMDRALLFFKAFNIIDPVGQILGEGLTGRLNDRGFEALEDYIQLLLGHAPYKKVQTVQLPVAPFAVAAGPLAEGDPLGQRYASVPLEDIPHGRRRDDLMVAEIIGNSMEPMLYSGDYVIYAPCETPKPGQVILCFYDGAMMIKEYQCEAGNATLVSYNDDEYPPIPLREGFSFTCQGEFVAKTQVLAIQDELVA